MFVDVAQVTITAGKGGDGIISFRREKFIAKGGPDGGDGGDGGDVVFVASNSENTLANFRYQKEIKAEDGKNGADKKKHGKSGEDLHVKVPVGTIVVSSTGETVADLTTAGQEAVVAKGGKGGFGNAHFTSSRRQAPRIAEKGEDGESFTATLELKMIADVGLVGLPNAGKSTFLASVSNAKPEIANYPFTTLRPNLGVVDIDSHNSILLADIPGLIQGASEGKGLGDDFLRHVERTKVLIHLIDAWQEDVSEAYRVIMHELSSYKTDISKKQQVVVLTKIDGLDEEILADQTKRLSKAVAKGTKVMAISSQSKKGVKELLYAVHAVVLEARKAEEAARKEAEEALPVITLPEGGFDDWRIETHELGFMVTGEKVERFARRTHFDSEDGVQRMRDILRKLGIMKELEKRGVELGQRIFLGSEDRYIEY